MATTNTVTTLGGFLKTSYAEKLLNTIPMDFALQRDTGKVIKKLGRDFRQAVRVRGEQGYAYAASGGPVTYETPVAGVIDEAVVQGFQGALKVAIDFETLTKAMESGELAYGDAGTVTLQNAVESARKRLEISLWHGQSLDGLGVVEAVDTNAITISAATWNPGNWIGMEGAVIEAFDPALTTQRTGTPTLNAVDYSTRTIHLSAAHTLLDADDRLFFKGQRTTSAWKDMKGLLSIGAHTSADGDLFDVSATANSIWCPNQTAIDGALSFEHIQNVLTSSIAKGLMGDAKLYCSIYSFQDLVTEQAALVRHGGKFDGRVFRNGAGELEFLYQGGTLTISPSRYCPVGKAVIVPMSSLKKPRRIGATDVTVRVNNKTGDLTVLDSSSTSQFLFTYSNQAYFTPAPGEITLLTGITSDAAPEGPPA